MFNILVSYKKNDSTTPFTHAIDVDPDGLCLWKAIAMQQTQNESPNNLIEDFVIALQN